MELKDKLAPAHTALIVIDIQKDFAAPDGLLGKRGRDLSLVEPMIDKLEVTIQKAQAANVPILYAKQVYDRTKLTSRQLEKYDLDGQLVTCDSATGGHEYYRIKPDPQHLYVKYDFNIFSNPNVLKILDEKNINTLVITGMDTGYCVETAIRHAFDLGFKVVVPEDLVAGNAKHMDMHNHTLKLTRKVFGTVTTSDVIHSIW